MNKKCGYCEEEIEEDYYYIYNLFVETNKQRHYIGLQKLMNELDDYLMNKSIHLSVSQVILFRPDIVKAYLNVTILDEEIISFHLEKYIICYECYSQYIEYVPLI